MGHVTLVAALHSLMLNHRKFHFLCIPSHSKPLTAKWVFRIRWTQYNPGQIIVDKSEHRHDSHSHSCTLFTASIVRVSRVQSADLFPDMTT